MRREFKVGERYSYSNTHFGKGIIEISNVQEDVILFKDIKGKCGVANFFHVGSQLAHELKRLTPHDSIVIYRKDNEIIALDKSTGEKALAKCNPNDEFDFHAGAKLAFQRLMGDYKTDESEKEIPSENQKMAKELKEIVTALEAEGFTHKEAVKFILAVASGKAGK